MSRTYRSTFISGKFFDERFADEGWFDSVAGGYVSGHFHTLIQTLLEPVPNSKCLKNSQLTTQKPSALVRQEVQIFWVLSSLNIVYLCSANAPAEFL